MDLMMYNGLKKTRLFGAEFKKSKLDRDTKFSIGVGKCNLILCTNGWSSYLHDIPLEKHLVKTEQRRTNDGELIEKMHAICFRHFQVIWNVTYANYWAD